MNQPWYECHTSRARSQPPPAVTQPQNTQARVAGTPGKRTRARTQPCAPSRGVCCSARLQGCNIKVRKHHRPLLRHAATAGARSGPAVSSATTLRAAVVVQHANVLAMLQHPLLPPPPRRARPHRRLRHSPMHQASTSPRRASRRARMAG